MDIEGLNRAAWDKAVEEGENPYTQVVSSQQIADARAGSWTIQLSEQRTVPAEWFPPLADLRVLCLAGGGGQQAPILAAAGAEVTLLDGSARQLGQDAFVAERDGLELRLVQGNMADLSAFGDASFDLVVNPVSTLFVPDVGRVWRECRRVLGSHGVLIAGFMNPDEFVFDPDALDERGEFVVKYPLPYVEHETLDTPALEARIGAGAMFHFSHTLEAQLGGMIDAGFVLAGFYEDRRTEADGNPIRFYLPSQFVVRALAIDLDRPRDGGCFPSNRESKAMINSDTTSTGDTADTSRVARSTTVLDEGELVNLQRCVELAEEALGSGDQPFGSVLVASGGEVLYEDRNREGAGDGTQHPEFAIARWAAQHCTESERAAATVYTSGEHCPMCSAAHAWVGLGRIVFASSADQTTRWYAEFGGAPSPVLPLPINAIAPGSTDHRARRTLRRHGP